MLKRFIAALAGALLAVTAVAVPAQAATYTRPVVLTASSSCVNYTWTVTAAVTSVRARLVDVYDSTDYGNRLIVGAVALQPGVAYRFTYRPGASAQYAEIGVFPAGSGGWNGWADPDAWKLVRDPIQTNPFALC